MHALTVTNLNKTYSGGTIALKNINLNVKKGDFFALLGQNGAGKSTTIGIICSLVNKTSGTVKIFGHDLDQERAQAKSLIGIVPQELNLSLFEKVSRVLINQAGFYGIPRKIAVKRMETYLKAMDIWHMRDAPAMRLSGGMKRRLMIARAMMNAPQLLILDEPTAGVDVELRHSLWAFLRDINQEGVTIILTTHYLEEAEYLCKNVAIIDQGEIIEDTSMKNLINRLKVQTFILDLEKPPSAPIQLPDFNALLIDETTLEVAIHQHQSINQLIHALNHHDIQVLSMRNKTNRLEQLFIDLIHRNKTDDSKK